MEDNSDFSTDKAVVRIWRTWRTVHQFVAERGYELSEEEVNISLEQFRGKFVADDGGINRGLLRFSARPSAAMLIKHTPLATASNPDPTPDCGPIYVEFLAESGTAGVGLLRKFINYTSENGFRAGILITHVPFAVAATKELRTVGEHLHVECFTEDEVLVNITHHELVPRHVLLSPAEKVALLRRYRLKETQLPRILQKDAAGKYLGLLRGQVVKIIRFSETAGRYASYRLCV